MEKNLELYEKVRQVPEEAQKPISGGRLNGMTDINPMWRIKTLTQQFGICGIGWYTDIIRAWVDHGANGEAIVSVEIKLYIKNDSEWSKGITGIGGSMLVNKEKNGLYTDDECYKKAYTDALSVACKALGMGADVYFAKDRTKYDIYKDNSENKKGDAPKQETTQTPKLQSKYSIIQNLIKGTQITGIDVDKWIEKSFGKVIKINDLTDGQFQALKHALEKNVGAAK